MDMNIQKYMAFIKTIEYESFTKAAEILNYSQSGISRMIADLEKEWKLSLLERGKFGVRMTSEGVKLYPFIKKVCSEYEKLRAEVDELNGLDAGLIRIATISSIATNILPDVIKKFRCDYPNIEYEILMGDYMEIEKWVIDGRVDFGFVRMPVKSDQLEIEFLERDRLLVIMPEDHPLASCEKFPIEKLSQESFMLLEKGGKSDIAQVLEKNGVKLKVDFTTWDDYAIMSMVESGLGISIIPELIMKRASYNIVAKELDKAMYREIGMVFRDKKNTSKAVKKFLTYIRSEQANIQGK